MNKARKRRLMTVAAMMVGVGVSVSLLLMALGSNLNHYYELDDIVSGKAPVGKVIRIGGIVAPGSIQRTPKTLIVDFVVTDLHRQLQVRYTGIVPDLFREGQGVLARGVLLDTEHFIAEEILTKHDENYLPKEVRQELEKNGYPAEDQRLAP